MLDAKTLVPFSTTLLIALGGCGQDGPKAEGSAAPAAASACSPDHTTVVEGGFCVKVPKVWEAKPPEKRGDTRTDFVWFRKGEGGIFVLDVDSKETMPDDVETRIAKSKDPQTVTKGDFAGGKGKWVMSVGDKSGIVAAFVAGPKGVIHCGGSGAKDGLEKDLELCKTILPL